MAEHARILVDGVGRNLAGLVGRNLVVVGRNPAVMVGRNLVAVGRMQVAVADDHVLVLCPSPVQLE